MRIAIGCDDTGFPLKEQVAPAQRLVGHARDNGFQDELTVDGVVGLSLEDVVDLAEQA